MRHTHTRTHKQIVEEGEDRDTEFSPLNAHTPQPLEWQNFLPPAKVPISAFLSKRYCYRSNWGDSSEDTLLSSRTILRRHEKFIEFNFVLFVWFQNNMKYNYDGIISKIRSPINYKGLGPVLAAHLGTEGSLKPFLVPEDGCSPAQATQQAKNSINKAIEIAMKDDVYNKPQLEVIDINTK